MGGQPAVEKLIDIFYRRAVADPLLKEFFETMPPEHVHLVALWFVEIFDGGTPYSAARGGEAKGHAYMIAQHLNLKITEDQRKRWVDVMLAAADEAHLPDDPEFRSAFIAYIEWGTRMAKMFSQPGESAPEESPMPTWGWGERTPFVG